MEVIWTDMATQQLGNIVKYVESEFGRSIAVKTLDKINSKIIRLSHFLKVESLTEQCLMINIRCVISYLTLMSYIIF